MSEILLELHDVKVNHRGKTIFEKLDFQWTSEQNWAVVGPNGSGKTAFLMALAGKFLAARGEIKHHYAHYYLDIEKENDPYFSYHNLISLVDFRHDFKNRSNLSQFYYQQRYNANDADDAMTVSEYLESKVVTTLRPNPWSIDIVIDWFNLAYSVDKSIIKLSNGESKRLRLASALLKNPKILMIDNAFTGLDPKTRGYFDDKFSEISAKGIKLLMVCTPNELPKAATNVIVFSECKIASKKSAVEFNTQKDYPDSIPTIDERRLVELVNAEKIDSYQTIVALKDASVQYGDKLILDSISWMIKSGERWALTGPNGSGKSTLLSLLNGDHPQAYACHLTLFDQKRGSGESIWDIKKKIGFMSPEFYQFFPTNYTCFETVVSGFSEALGSKSKPTPEQRKLALEWINMFQLTKERDVSMDNLPSSKQRLCLLARALVKNPVLLILDEPCQGLDHQHQEQFRSIINKICKETPISLIYVTHYHEQLPNCIDHTLELD